MQPKILVVEDEAITAFDIKKTLEIMDFDVVSTASTGKDAIQKAKELKPDLILMDVVLKDEMDGIEAASKIQTMDIPIIFLTAFSDEVMFERVKLTNLYGFISKPVNFDELKAAIEIALYKHKIDRKLRESDNNLKAFLNAINEPALLIETNGKVIVANEVLANRLGKTVDEITDTIIYDHLPTEVGELRRRYTEKIVKTRKYINYDEKRHDIFYNQRGYPILDKEGKVSRIAVIGFNITDRKKIENKLLESTLKLSLALDSGDIGVHELNMANGELIWDNMLRAHWGLSPGAPINFDIFMKGIHPDDRERVRLMMKNGLETMKSRKYHAEFRIIGIEDGIERWIKSEAQVFFEENKPVKVIGIARDITENKKLEDKLRKSHTSLEEQVKERTSELEDANELLKESEKKFRNLAENLPFTIRRIDKDYRFIYSNKDLKFFGLSNEDLIGKTIDDIGMKKDIVEKWKMHGQKTFQTGKIHKEINDIHTPDGIITLESILVPEFNMKNEIESILVITQDITELKKLNKFEL